MFGSFGELKFMPTLASCIHSNVAFFGEPYKLFGRVVEAMILCPGLHTGGMPLFVITMSYNGKLAIKLTGDRAVFPDEMDLKRFADYVKDEFDMLDRNGGDV